METEELIKGEAVEPFWANGSYGAKRKPLVIAATVLTAVSIPVTAACFRLGGWNLGVLGILLLVASVALFFVPADGIAWDKSGVTWLRNGKPRRHIHWSAWGAGTLQTKEPGNLAVPQPSDSQFQAWRAMHTAALAHIPPADPRTFEYDKPPMDARSRKIWRVWQLVSGYACMWTCVMFAVSLKRIIVAETWPPEFMWLAQGLVFGLFWLEATSRVNRTDILREQPWRWSPVGGPSNWKVAAATPARIGLPPPVQLEPGRMYVTQASSIGTGQRPDLLMGQLCAGACLFIVPFIPAVGRVFQVVSGVVCALGLVFAMIATWRLQRKNEVQIVTAATIECTANGIRIWKDGRPSAELQYPHPVRYRRFPWSRGREVEVYRDGDHEYAIDRQTLTAIPDDAPPCVRYAATEGNGWLHPESKAIAEQMLAERDWSKPLPKKGQ